MPKIHKYINNLATTPKYKLKDEVYNNEKNYNHYS